VSVLSDNDAFTPGGTPDCNGLERDLITALQEELARIPRCTWCGKGGAARHYGAKNGLACDHCAKRVAYGANHFGADKIVLDAIAKSSSVQEALRRLSEPFEMT